VTGFSPPPRGRRAAPAFGDAEIDPRAAKKSYPICASGPVPEAGRRTVAFRALMDKGLLASGHNYGQSARCKRTGFDRNPVEFYG